ncbi:MAG: head-tail connector protein [Pseudomonadota bacterium]
MSLKQTAAPGVEPVTLAEAKAFLRVDTNDEDTFVESLITTSRLHIEAALGLALITQSWRLVVPTRAAPVAIPLHPVAAVTAVHVRDGESVETEVSLSDVSVDLDVRPACVQVPAVGVAADKTVVAFDAGFGPMAADVPAPIRQALLQLIAHWFENREPITFGTTGARIPDTVSALLAPYRQVRL